MSRTKGLRTVGAWTGETILTAVLGGPCQAPFKTCQPSEDNTRARRRTCMLYVQELR